MKSSPLYSRRSFAVVYTCWWLLLSLVQIFVLHRLGLSWKIATIDSFSSNILLGVFGLTALIIFRFYQPGKENRLYRFVFVITFILIYCSALSHLLTWMLREDTAYLVFLERSMPLRFISALMILSFITILNWLMNILEEQKEHTLRRNQAEQLVKDAELVKLRQQLQPHFLFNSLNSISALAGSRPEEARRMIQQLSDFLRGTLKKDEQQTVSLKEEIDHLRLYLEIEKVRFGHRLNVDLNIAEEAIDDKIPPLLLQPLMENAIKFGLYGTIEQITVLLEAKRSGRELEIRLQNPFDEETGRARQGTGFGLDSVNRRLLLLYSRSDLLKTEKAGHLFITTLRIPQ